ncbi:hypothetical protein [Mesorhizobium sp. LSJC264A00]|uniref:hypothetical protein n=1 Tax=unclassified Mesorhizobium TaxID=325217 RepID=UPI0003CF5C2E|nr:hypothetical protein [Mesorhizobium sp. LSJC264A00]ESX21182.1 hypothetical protein X767_20755 [Mesorhizobium sp. LSJC264A00]
MPITKTEGARRQLETAIDLYFENGDSLSIHTLAFAVLKVLFDIYPHRVGDGFAAQLDALLRNEGWKAMSGVANFLKHADRDPDAFLDSHHPQQAMSIIGLGVILYRRVEGDLSKKMMAFDSWVELLGQEELGIAEVDTNEERAARHREIRHVVAQLPHEEMIKVARQHYVVFLENYDRIKSITDQAILEGISVTQLLDIELGQEGTRAELV